MSKQIRKPITAQEQLEMDIMAETELSRLQRQYRIMDGDRRAFEEETSTQLQKQKKVLKILKNERRELLENINVASSKINKKKDAEVCLKIQRLVRESDQYDEAIRKQRNDLKEIEFQIKKVSKDVLVYKKKQVTDEHTRRRILEGQRTVHALQNKLGHCVKKFCSVLAENKQLREEIDHLLRERALFNKIWQACLKSLNDGKKVMMDLVEQATVAYDQREEWCQKLQALKIRAHNDLLTHMSEMRELFRQLDHDASLQDFFSVKGQKRIMKDLEKKEQMKRQQAKENLEKQLLHYKETLAKVQELAQEEDISKLSAQFIKQEEENFALFNYVNELNHELEILTDNISNLYISIEEQKELNAERAEQQKDTIDSLKVQLETIKEVEKVKKESLEKKESELELILKGIEGLFKMVNCDNTPILNLLAETGKINNHNVMVYLGILENRIDELMKIANYKDKILEKPSSQRILCPLPVSRSKSQILRFLTESPCSLCAEELITHEPSDLIDRPTTNEQILRKFYGEYGKESVLHSCSNCKIFYRIDRANKYL